MFFSFVICDFFIVFGFGYYQILDIVLSTFFLRGSSQVTLQEILVFTSGADRIPPLGFPQKPTIQFLHPEDHGLRIFPEANTCDVTFRLPLHQLYQNFTEKMESEILQSPTFGFA
ncbi:MAG: hypothetical protein ACRC7H_02145 [Plesiomonas shigelloides]